MGHRTLWSDVYLEQVDTHSVTQADIYSHGDSERIIGKAIKKYNIPRQNLVLFSKAYFGLSQDGTQYPLPQCSVNDGDMVNRVGLSRKKLLNAVDDSVERLGTYIDVFMIHRLDRDTPKEEIMRALNDIVESGKVRYVGASSVSSPSMFTKLFSVETRHMSFMAAMLIFGQMAAWEFQQMQNIAEKHGWHKFISMQNYMNLLYREEEREMVPYCQDSGIGITSWSPISRGILARPWKQEKTKREQTDQNALPFADVDEKIVARVDELSKKKGLPMAAIATAWVLQKGSIPIVGLTSTERIDQSLLALKCKLSDEEMKYLEELYLPRPIQGY